MLARRRPAERGGDAGDGPHRPRSASASRLPARRDGTLVYANAAYLELAATLGLAGTEKRPPELLDAEEVARLRLALAETGKPRLSTVTIGAPAPSSSTSSRSRAARPATCSRALDRVAAARDAGLAHLSGIIDALATPIAIFNARRELVQANRAYAALWHLDPAWLRPGMDERAILDRLRTDGSLPNEPDYHAWRARHLTSYQLTRPEERGPWHLPDGRTIQVIAAPAGPAGGVIYGFEDITATPIRQSQHRSLPRCGARRSRPQRRSPCSAPTAG